MKSATLLRVTAPQQYSQAQVAQLGLGLGSVVSKYVSQIRRHRQAGVSLLFMSFSRSELNAGGIALGVEYSSKAGYDANYMANYASR